MSESVAVALLCLAIIISSVVTAMLGEPSHSRKKDLYILEITHPHTKPIKMQCQRLDATFIAPNVK